MGELISIPKRPRLKLKECACVYCGRQAASWDHVPPRSVLVGSPNDVIKVPACLRCNNGRSRTDELFRVFVTHDAGDGAEIPEELAALTRRTLRHNQKLNRQLLRTSRWFPKIDRIEVPFPVAMFRETFSAWTRALHWLEYGKVLDPQTPITVTRHKATDDALILRGLNPRSVAKGQFVYAFNRCTDNHDVSIWFFVIHRTFAMAVTNLDKLRVNDIDWKGYGPVSTS